MLERLQQAAAAADRLFPLSLAAQGSAQIGGNLSTNAGGTGVLAYGNARELCLGVEVVLPTGEVLDDLRKLKKDNTGYDLKDLFVGAEGTLGVITAAVLKLFPKPRGREVRIGGRRLAAAALSLFAWPHGSCRRGAHRLRADRRAGARVRRAHAPGVVRPLASPWYVLMRDLLRTFGGRRQGLIEELLAAALDMAVSRDAVLAASLAQGAALWEISRDNPRGAEAGGRFRSSTTFRCRSPRSPNSSRRAERGGRGRAGRPRGVLRPYGRRQSAL